MTHPLLSDKRLVSFDAGFTLIEPYPTVGEVYRRVALRRGHDLDAAVLDERARALYRERFITARREGCELHFCNSEDKALAWWLSLAEESFRGLVAQDELPALARDCFDEFARGDCWRPYPDVRPTLEALRGRGLALAVCSNWDGRLRRTLDELDLAGCFDDLFISSEVGYEKPHPGIFEAMLEHFGLEAQDGLHVGDSVTDDLRGAARLGLPALLLRRENRPVPEAHDGPEIDSLAELLG